MQECQLFSRKLSREQNYGFRKKKHILENGVNSFAAINFFSEFFTGINYSFFLLLQSAIEHT